MSLSQASVSKLYTTVIDDVIGGVREFFLDEGVDEQVLIELKTTWQSRLQATNAIEVKQDPEPQPPILKQPVVQQKPVVNNHLVQPVQTVPMEIPKTVQIQLTLPAPQGVPNAEPRAITIQVPATALQGNQLQSVLTGQVIAATMALPQHMASALLQQHVTAALQGQTGTTGIVQMQAPAAQPVQTTNTATTDNTQQQTFQSQTGGVAQLDGQNDSSDDDDDDDDDDEVDEDDDDDDDVDDKDEEEENEENDGPEEEPLNSGDDVSEEDPLELFETDNVVVCQYDKITRTRNKWKFYLKDGIMNLGGKDYVFQKSNGDAEW